MAEFLFDERQQIAHVVQADDLSGAESVLGETLALPPAEKSCEVHQFRTCLSLAMCESGPA